MKKQLMILLLILPLSMTLNACEKESIKVVNEEYASERVLNSDEEEKKKRIIPRQ